MLNPLVLILFGIFCLLIAFLLFANTDPFKSYDKKLADKIKEHLQIHNNPQEVEVFMPSLSITKSWKVDDAVLGELVLTASGETSKIARENISFLYELSNKHDNQCLEK